MGCVLGLRRIAQDRARQAIRGIEVVLDEARKGSPLVDLFGRERPSVCHVHDLERLAHDDMTIGVLETFTSIGLILGA